MKNFSEHIARKIVNQSFFVENEDKLHQQKIVFTNGCFDLLHCGHITYLAKARELGDVLVLGLNSDASVKRLKGPTRPVNPQDARALVLAALEMIDYVVVFEEDTPYELIAKVKPDVLVKGGDYEIDNIVGGDIVRERGGVVTTIPFVDGFSTTSMINNLKK
ncbi:MAG: D-glycero-beta-D-manno-heptose 1-phosphate adenylyltransferase [Bacteroidales bacterium]|nr:D-glycero-beta-D-manno-heptose 1-phosphate adenylyltransferase [Bacteroidales bacterium]